MRHRSLWFTLLVTLPGLAAQSSQLAPGLLVNAAVYTVKNSAVFQANSCTAHPIAGRTYMGTYDHLTAGAGRLHVNAALNHSGCASQPALSSTVSYGTATLLSDCSVIWGSRVITSSSVIWGSSPVGESSTIAANSVIWGSLESPSILS